MPWLEERTLTLFVRDTEVRRYEPGVRERGVDVKRPAAPLVRPSDPNADRTLPLEAPVVHRDLIRQHPSVVFLFFVFLFVLFCHSITMTKLIVFQQLIIIPQSLVNTL